MPLNGAWQSYKAFSTAEESRARSSYGLETGSLPLLQDLIGCRCRLQIEECVFRVGNLGPDLPDLRETRKQSLSPSSGTNHDLENAMWQALNGQVNRSLHRHPPALLPGLAFTHEHGTQRLRNSGHFSLSALFYSLE